MSRIPTPSESTTTKKIPHHFLCPITQEIMTEPVVCADGHSYERAAITTWFATKDTSPLTNDHLANKSLTPNIALRESIKEFFEASSKPLSEKVTQAQQVTAPSPTLPVGTDAVVVAVAQDGDYPIHCAIRNNNLGLLSAFSLSEKCLQQKNRDGKRPIELAAELGYWNLVVYITKKFRLDEYCFNDCGYGNAMYMAAAHDETKAFLALFNANAKIYTPNGQEHIIHHVIRNKNIIMLDALLKERILDARNANGKTGIELAADLGYWDLVIRIAKKHALETPTHEDPYNYSNVLYKAAVENKTEAFLALLRAGARTNTRNSQGDWVAHIAVRNKNLKIWDAILTLIRNQKLSDVNLYSKNTNGKTPIELAAELGHWDLIIFIAKRYTIQWDSDTNIKDAYANVLALATSQNKADVITALLKAGAKADRPLQQQALVAAPATSNVTFFPAPAATTPSLARLKSYYLLEAGFFNASTDIFNTDDTAKVLETLRKRAQSKPGGTSEKTLEVFGLGK